MPEEISIAVRGVSPGPYLSLAPPLVLGKAFEQIPGQQPAFEYGRGSTPSTKALEQSLIVLEYAKYAITFSSGLAAETALFLTILKKNGEKGKKTHVLFHRELYGGTVRLIEQFLRYCNFEFSYADFNSPKDIEKSLRDDTSCMFLETPTNPKLTIIDLKRVATLSRARKIPFVVDNTFSTPILTKPLHEFGAYAVIESLSKYLSGHNDVIGGAVITSEKELSDSLELTRRATGGVLEPSAAYRTMQGIKTLPLRIKQQSETAYAIAHFLSKQKDVEHVYYPGLADHPGHEIAKKQMHGYFGGMVSFHLKADEEGTRKFIHGVTAPFGTPQLPIISYSESLGATETLLSCPFFMSHAGLTPEERKAQNITPSFLRISCGLESPKDLIQAFENGFHSLHQ